MLKHTTTIQLLTFHTMVAEMANIPRKQAKTINLGLIYGMGVNKMSEDLDVSVEEAKKLTKAIPQPGALC